MIIVQNEIKLYLSIITIKILIIFGIQVQQYCIKGINLSK